VRCAVRCKARPDRAARTELIAANATVEVRVRATDMDEPHAVSSMFVSVMWQTLKATEVLLPLMRVSVRAEVVAASQEAPHQ
jgi:hypothetical protein